MKVLYLFSGHGRKTSVASVISKLSKDKDFDIEVEEVDICLSPEHDMADRSKQEEILAKIKQGYYIAILVTPPCSTWSRVRGANTRGPPMIRSREYPWGFPWLAKKYHHELHFGNGLVRFTIEIVTNVVALSKKHRTRWCVLFAEHPEDLGTIWREEDGKELHPASVWQLPDLKEQVDNSAEAELRTIAINQCCWGAPYRKPTRLISNMRSGVLAYGPLSAHELCYHQLAAKYVHLRSSLISFICGRLPSSKLLPHIFWYSGSLAPCAKGGTL